MNYEVKLVGRSHYVMGLAEEQTLSGVPDPDTMLIFYYEGGDVDTKMQNADMMHGALYGLYQCHDGLKEGDTFTTEFGTFVCEGVHVLPCATPSKVTTKDCRRCNGEGYLPHFNHVVGGVCFRCWGLGTDPKTLQELEAWLVKARLEYKARRQLVRNGAASNVVKTELALIEKMGKANRKRADRLRASFEISRASKALG